MVWRILTITVKWTLLVHALQTNSSKTTNEAIITNYLDSLVGLSRSRSQTWWSIPGQCHCKISPRILVTIERNSWYCFRITFCYSGIFRFFAIIALSILDNSIFEMINFTFFMLSRMEDSFIITPCPQKCCSDRTCDLICSIFVCQMCLHGLLDTPCAVSEESWHCVI